MAKRPELSDLTSLTNSSAINTLSQNWDAIQEAFDNTLSLDGSTPNAMEADLDLNGNALLNVGTIDVSNLTLDGQTVTDLASVPEWKGAWVTSTSYAKNDLVKTSGNVYICLVAHTSGTFATDLTALKWELMVSKGDSGAGTGDLLSANNLSDVANPATARANLGLGTVATENVIPVSKGGTGGITASDARANLGINGDIPALEALATTGIAVRTASDTWATRTVTSSDNSITITNPSGVAGDIDLSAPTQWTLVETLDCSSGTTKETATFEAGKDYLFVFQGVSTNTGTNQPYQIAFYGATAAAYTAATSFSDANAASNYEYGEYIFHAPMRSTKTHVFMGQAFRTTTANTSNQTIGLTAGRFGAMCNYNTAQGIEKVRFSIAGGANFDGGSILVFKR